MALHAAVSARALALTHQARAPEASETPARKAFSSAELTALRALRAAREMETPAKLSVAQAVLYVAILGGYLPSKHPPGPRIIRRGLERLVVAAAAIEAIGAVGPPKKPQRSRRK
jgi:RecB family exonuclease